MRALLLTLLLLCFQSVAFATEAPVSYEQSILDAIRNIQGLNHAQALDSTRKLIKQYPNSRLGQMLYADLLLAKTEPLAQIGSGISTDLALRDFTQEIQLRWQHNKNSAYKGLLPENILFMAKSQPYVILVDQQNSRIYVYRNQNGTPVLETDYFITIGLKGPGKQNVAIRKHRSAFTTSPDISTIRNYPTSMGGAHFQLATRMSGMFANNAPAAVSGYTAHPPIPITARRWPATAALWLATRTFPTSISTSVRTSIPRLSSRSR